MYVKKRNAHAQVHPGVHFCIVHAQKCTLSCVYAQGTGQFQPFKHKKAHMHMRMCAMYALSCS